MSDAVNKVIKDQEQAEDAAFEEAFNDAVDGKPQAEDDADDDPDEDPDDEEDDPEDEDPAESEEEPSKADKEPEKELTLEEQLAQVTQERDQLKHRIKSDEGRVNAYQRQAMTVQQKLEALTKKVEDPANTEKERDAAKERLAQQANNSTWEEFEEEFPEFAMALNERLGEIDAREKAFEKRFGDLESKVQPLTQQAQQSALQSEFAALEAAHPDYEEVSGSEEFSNWLEKQPVPVQQLINSNAASDAAYLLDNFKRDTGQDSDSRESQANQRNQARLQSNVAVTSKPRPRRPVADDDYESAFEAAVAAKNRNR